MTLPPLDDLLLDAVPFAIPLTVRFRGTDVREGLLIRGPAGWGEFAPFPEYGPGETSRWLAAAIEAAWQGWPVPVRDVVHVNAIIPVVSPDLAASLVRESGCTTAKVKVADPGQSLDDDVERVAAVRDALGPQGGVRIDANGAWTFEEARDALRALEVFDLEYVEQPCATLHECAQVRRTGQVRVAIDEGVRRAGDPRAVDGLREAADVLVLKVPPLGGVRAALDVAATYGLPCVVSSALDTSVGLAAGLALAGALPDLPFACGLASGRLLKNDVATDRLLPVGGRLEVRPVSPDARSLDAVGAPPSTLAAWGDRVRVAYAVLASRGNTS
ncbi:MAG: o-succinylbenzoate synthase [Actinomycetes bacterium]